LQSLDSVKYAPAYKIKSLQAKILEFPKLPEGLQLKAAEHLILYSMAQGGFSERTQYDAISARSGLKRKPKLFSEAMESLMKKGIVGSSKKGRGRKFYRITREHGGLIQKYSIKAAKRI
jgi:hypothetical protein